MFFAKQQPASKGKGKSKARASAAKPRAGRSSKGYKAKGEKEYAAHRRKMAARQSAASKEGRDIGEIPAVAHPQRRAQASESLEFFLRTYFPDTFVLMWSDDHREVIASTETAVKQGGLFAYAMPRGSGKTSIAERAVLWAMLLGFRRYIAFIGSDEGAAVKLLATIQTELESNELLQADFPEVCYPISKLERIAGRCRGQTYKGEPTFIGWTANMVILPAIAGSVASNAIVEVRGITSGIRGMKFARPCDGKNVRPDFVIVEDPQTDQSSRSPSQCAQRLRTVRQAVLGLAGPGKKIAGVMTCTVITPGDMADQLLDRQQHPEWNGKRTKLVYDLPTNEPLWEQYARLRADSMRAGLGAKPATDFYLANRAAMDAGSRVAWPARFNPETEISALQHAMNLRADLGDAAFAAEYQNEPLRPSIEQSQLPTADEIAAKTNNLERGMVPREATKLVCFIDVQKTALPWMVCSAEDDFTGACVDYGFFPEQGREYFTLAQVKRTLQLVLKTVSLEETLYQGLKALTEKLLGREWPREGGGVVRIERCLIDANWGESTDVVYQFCRESEFAAILVPTHGRFVGATSRPFNEYRKKPGDEIGDHWRRPVAGNKRDVRYGLFDSNFWKSFVFQRLRTAVGGRGCFTLFGTDAQRHRMLADHLTSEEPVDVSAKGRTITEFKMRPARMDNHLLDCFVGCCVALSMLRIALKERQLAPARERKTVSFAEMARNAGLTGGI